MIWASGHGVVLLAVFAGTAIATGFWDILVALAPEAYLLVFSPYDSENSPKTVVVINFSVGREQHYPSHGRTSNNKGSIHV